MEKASVIIPAFNEALRIENTIKSLTGIAEISQIIVVDDGSKDNTGHLAEQAGAEVLRLPVNVGKGGALARGLEKARERLVVFLDADLEETAAEAVKLIEPVIRGEAELVVAHWLNSAADPPRGGFGLVVSLARWGIRIITGFEAKSPLSGQRAAIKEYLGIFEKGYGVEVGMTIDCLAKGGRIVEVPVSMRHRYTGLDYQGVSHRLRQFCDVMRVIWKRYSRDVKWK